MLPFEMRALAVEISESERAKTHTTHTHTHECKSILVSVVLVCCKSNQQRALLKRDDAAINWSVAQPLAQTNFYLPSAAANALVSFASRLVAASPRAKCAIIPQVPERKSECERASASINQLKT